jgi:hypothetical protein
MKELKEKLNYLKENPFSRAYVQDKFLASMGFRSIRVKNYGYYSVPQMKQNKKLKKKL